MNNLLLMTARADYNDFIGVLIIGKVGNVACKAVRKSYIFDNTSNKKRNKPLSERHYSNNSAACFCNHICLNFTLHDFR